MTGWWQSLHVAWRAVLIVSLMILGLLFLQFFSHLSTRI